MGISEANSAQQSLAKAHATPARTKEQDDSGPGMFGSSPSRKHENARADNGADAQRQPD